MHCRCSASISDSLDMSKASHTFCFDGETVYFAGQTTITVFKKGNAGYEATEVADIKTLADAALSDEEKNGKDFYMINALAYADDYLYFAFSYGNSWDSSRPTFFGCVSTTDSDNSFRYVTANEFSMVDVLNIYKKDDSLSALFVVNSRYENAVSAVKSIAFTTGATVLRYSGSTHSLLPTVSKTSITNL